MGTPHHNGLHYRLCYAVVRYERNPTSVTPSRIAHVVFCGVQALMKTAQRHFNRKLRLLVSGFDVGGRASHTVWPCGMLGASRVDIVYNLDAGWS